MRRAYHQWRANRAALKMARPGLTVLDRKLLGAVHDFHAAKWHNLTAKKEGKPW